MTLPCRRCDWTTTAEEIPAQRSEAAQHADDAGHPLCHVCHHSLTADEPATCEKCLTRTRQHLTELVEQYALLPEELGHPKATVYDSDQRGGGDGRPLPGGNVLATIGPGSPGGVARRLTTAQAAQPERWWLLGSTGPLTQTAAMAAERERTGREHAADNHQDDPPSIAEFLASWEADWREAHGQDPAAGPSTVVGSAGYLEVHARWAANNLGDFPDFAHELRQVLDYVKRLAGRDERPLRAAAACFDCGAPALERTWADPHRCKHTRPSQSLLRINTAQGRRPETDQEREARLERWDEEHAQCDQGGLVETWTCAKCGRAYEPAAYWLAVSERLKAEELRHA